jgi:hypothetical protein
MGADISKWDVSSALSTSRSGMYQARSRHLELGCVERRRHLEMGCVDRTVDISKWDVSSTIDISE